jgi:hypothetical protein
VKRSERSPDGAYIADWYTLSGGGAAGASSDTVSLRHANEPFVLKKDWVCGAIDAHDVSLKWISTRELEVTFQGGTVDTKQLTWNGITVRCLQQTQTVRPRP